MSGSFLGARPVIEVATIRWSLRSDLHRRATAYGAVTLLLSYRGKREFQLVPTTIHGPASRYPFGAGDGNRTRDSGVAHRRVTSTLRLLGGVLDQTPLVEDRRWRIQLRPATHTSHPLESNQNLPGFNRARRPTTQEWDHEHRVRTFGRRAHDAQIIIISSSIVRERSSPVSVIWSQIRTSRRSQNGGNEKKAAGVSPGGLRGNHVVTWLACRTSRAIRTGRGADQVRRWPTAFGSLIRRTMKVQFRHDGHSLNESSMVHTDNSGHSICQTVSRRRI